MPNSSTSRDRRRCERIGSRRRDGALEPLIDGTVLRGMESLDALIEFVRANATE